MGQRNVRAISRVAHTVPTARHPNFLSSSSLSPIPSSTRLSTVTFRNLSDGPSEIRSTDLTLTRAGEASFEAWKSFFSTFLPRPAATVTTSVRQHERPLSHIVASLLLSDTNHRAQDEVGEPVISFLELPSQLPDTPQSLPTSLSSLQINSSISSNEFSLTTVQAASLTTDQDSTNFSTRISSLFPELNALRESPAIQSSNPDKLRSGRTATDRENHHIGLCLHGDYESVPLGEPHTPSVSSFLHHPRQEQPFWMSASSFSVVAIAALGLVGGILTQF